ncbi:hypothetical protein BDW74DRAFT_157003 [Aspergillus multicolor]|uniref:uncharacterized protein n=1 Tax=Aspergillus multicolor TaxID=41759 RepID=UPI003CCCAF27
MNGEGLSSYPVLMGVSPDPDSDMASFQHLESVDINEDSFDAADDSQESDDSFHQPYTITPAIVAHHPQQCRHNNCSHSTVTRQWRIDQYETCNNCGRRPFLKWFYLCTEDATDYAASTDRNGSLLSDSITEAILDGEYTDKQRDKLWQQKLEVLELCEMERTLSMSGSSYDPGQGTAQQYEFHKFETDQSRLSADVHSRPGRCQYRACYHCDRKLQERTWVSLNEVCNNPDIKPLSAWDLWETPVSDANVVKNLGLRAPRPPPPPPHFTQYSHRAFHRRRSRRTSHLAGYESSLNMSALSNLATIEEINEEIETLSTEIHKRGYVVSDVEGHAPFIESDDEELEISVHSHEDGEE